MIETDIERLYEVPGIGKKRVEKIRESWEKQKDIKNVMLFLQGFGVSTAYAAKIYRQYGKESIDKVKENPYRLADDIWGIGFKTADGIARKMGYEMNDERRLRSGLIYTLNQLADEGHCYAEEELLIATAKHPHRHDPCHRDGRPDARRHCHLPAAVLLCRVRHCKPPEHIGTYERRGFYIHHSL